MNGWRVETGNCDEAGSADKTGLAIVEAGRAGLFSGKAAARRPAVVRIGVAEINEHRGKAVAESGCNKPSNQPTDLQAASTNLKGAFARRLPAPRLRLRRLTRPMVSRTLQTDAVSTPARVERTGHASLSIRLLLISP